MRDRKYYRAILIVIFLGAAISAGGIFIGVRDNIGLLLLSFGILLVIGGIARSFILAAVISLLVGGVGGYYLEGPGYMLLGILFGCVFGGIGGGAIGWWTGRIRTRIDEKMDATMSDLDMKKDAALMSIRELEKAIRRTGPYHRDPGFYNREIRYIWQQLKNIRYDDGETRSMDDAAGQYQEIMNYLDRMWEKVDPAYSASTDWTIEAQRYKMKDINMGLGIEERPYGGGPGFGKMEKKLHIKPSKHYEKSLSPMRGHPVSPRIARAFRRYRIDRLINSSDFSDVYYATDAEDRMVVVKVPRLDKDKTKDKMVLIDYLSNADMWKGMDHENIVKLYRREVTPSYHLAMERMDGGNLDGLMKTYVLSVEEVVHIMSKLLEAMSYAHKKGVIHRDLKPRNVMFGKEGTVKISDWGWNGFQRSVHPKKYAEYRMSEGYCAPEQIDSKEFGKVNEATDVFLLGLMFYEMLTGSNPFHDEDPEMTVANICRMEPEPPSATNPDVPEELDEVVMTALNKPKIDRWINAEEMHGKLLELVEE